MVIALSTTVWLFSAAGFISLTAFVGLILVPAVSSFGRWPEKIAAGFLSLFIFGTLITVGIVAGLAYVFFSQDITDVFPWSGG